jgi:uncharacterized membrane protein YeaQ/YmgE (transglycosylase-associated protein family)
MLMKYSFNKLHCGASHHWPVARSATGCSKSLKEHFMSFIGFLILGLLAGALAKLILPGKQGGGIFITMLLGVIGAFLGGFIGGSILGVNLGSTFSLMSILFAVIGALIVLVIYGAITGRKRSRV